MALLSLSHLFHSMELDLIKGGMSMSKDNITQPYKIYDNWLSEIEDYIQNVVTGKSTLKSRNMNNFSRNDYLVGQERNNTINQDTNNKQPYLETKSREQRLNDLISKKNDHTRGKGKWLV
jgi:hypothetical protein